MAFTVFRRFHSIVACGLRKARTIISRCTKPIGPSPLLGTVTDLARSKPQLIAENVLLRQQLIVLNRSVKRPCFTRTDRVRVVLLPSRLHSWKEPLRLQFLSACRFRWQLGEQVGAGAVPRSAGNVHAGDGLLAWASAAAVGDYVTAQQHMEDDALLYAVWKDHHATFGASITGYRVLHTETAGQTTTARVQFDANDGKGPRCITVQVNEHTQKVRADRVYGPCP